MRVIRDLKMPMWNSAPASWRCLVIELVFSIFKAAFRKAFEANQDKWLLSEESKIRGGRMKMVMLSIEMAWRQVKPETIKKIYCSQTSKAAALIRH